MSVCLSVTLRSKLGRFRNGLCSFTSSKTCEKYCFHNFSQEKRYLFCNLFLDLFFTIFFAIFSCIGLIIFKIFRELDQNMQFRVVFACILLQKPKKPLRNVDDADDELDDASSVQIILLIRIVHIIFFRISTQKALRATLLRGCFLVLKRAANSSLKNVGCYVRKSGGCPDRSIYARMLEPQMDVLRQKNC